ncbi:MAG TPA: nucleoside-diphosphate sugar epimerase [Ramlibacter sp.]|nr:nucleoside-diphosphate sugar epimerase [Ramlibacter sp.]
MSSSPRTALLAGATGLVGREILAGLLADPAVGAVHVLARRPLPSSHPKLAQQVVDFTRLPALPRVDEVYLALGTTIKVAGSQEAFRAVDHDAGLAVARGARTAGATRLGLVSAMGASARSRVFYSRVKGELEDAVQGLGCVGVVIARPSVLAGDRESLGQPVRSGERLALRVSTWLRPLVPADYRSIQAADVAAALLAAVPRAAGVRVLPSGRMQRALSDASD